MGERCEVPGRSTSTTRRLAASLHDPALRAVAREGLEPLRRAERAIVDQQAAGKLRDDISPKALAQVITALLQGALLQLCWRDDIDLTEYRDALGALLRSVGRPDVATT